MLMIKANDYPSRQKEFLKKFNLCRPVLSAVGDDNRQLIIQVLIQKCSTGGLRVNEIQSNTNISRTAVSHHLKILREAGIINVRKDGTKNFYYLDSESSSLKTVAEFWQESVEMMNCCPLQNKRRI